MKENKNLPQLIEVQKQFVAVCSNAKSLRIANNFGAAFEAVVVVKTLREILTDEIMNAVFMPLMNTKVGFLTDRSGKPDRQGNIKPLYTIAVVRDAIIDAVSVGLMPTGNQINIIAERMYPTKEGYTHLLTDLGVKYILDIGIDDGTNKDYAKIPVKINYEHKGEKNSFTTTATVKKDSFSSHDQLRGKAERRAKKVLYEYLTGFDMGDADEESSVSDIPHVDATIEQKQKLNVRNEDEARKFFIDNGYKEEAVKGKGLYEIAKKESLDIIFVTGESNIDNVNQKKNDLRNWTNRNPQLNLK